MQPKATVVVLHYSVLLVLLFDSICGDPQVRSNRRKQLTHERLKKRWTYSEDDGGDLTPDGDLRPGWPVATPICTQDEYYDVNVQACSRCSDICRPNIELTFCANKCQEYYRIHFESSNHPEVRLLSSAVTVISSPDGAIQERLTSKPLFWTSIVSMTIAVAATVAIIMLCIRRRKTRGGGGGGGFGGSMEPNEHSRERTLSEASDDRDPEQRTLLRNTREGIARNTGCADERRDIDASDNRSMYMTGGGHTMDRFGTGCCNHNDHSDLPATPSPDRDRNSSPQKLLQKYYDSDHENYSTKVYQDPVKVNIWTRRQKQNGEESSPSLRLALFADNNYQRHLPTDSGPSSAYVSPTPSTAYSQETPYTPSMHEVRQAIGKKLPHLHEEDETYVKGNLFIDSKGPQHLPRQGDLPRQDDFSLEPKSMGILLHNGNYFDDVRKLEVIVRMTTSNDRYPSHCPKDKATLYSNSSSTCDDRLTTVEPN